MSTVTTDHDVRRWPNGQKRYSRDRWRPEWNRTRDTDQARLEDFEWLLRTEPSPEQIAARLGMTPGALARWLYRIGRPEQGRIWERVEGRDRRRRERERKAAERSAAMTFSFPHWSTKSETSAAAVATLQTKKQEQ